ncbi:MAG: Fibronectin type protein [Candidatus Saccharibacteria bacterium]|nr:Fibronectin type protein [Candidatus Saccharibacteria bacterium]
MNRFRLSKSVWLLSVLLGLLLSLSATPVLAVTNPQSGPIGLQGTVASPPPTQAAVISLPRAGQVFTAIPITVSGLCPKGTVVKIFKNGVFAGSADCANGSFSLQIDLFSGQNDLIARVYDSLDQAGPDSTVVTVTFQDATYGTFGNHVSLTSSYAKRGANPGQTLSWPIILSGGTAPYAISVDWGDGKAPDLISLAAPGTFTPTHVYAAAGVYNVIVKATDKNGVAAFLQLVAIANGAVGQTSSQAGSTNAATKANKFLWGPAILLVPLTVTAYFLGRRSQLQTLKKRFNQ